MGLEEKKYRSYLSEKLYIFCFVIWSVLNVIFNYSTLGVKMGLPLSSYIIYVDLAVILLLFVKIFIGNTIYTQKQLVLSVILLLTGLLIYFSTGSRSVLMVMLFIVSAKDVNIDRMLLILYRCEIIVVGLLIILSLFNVIPNKVTVGTYIADQRYCLGFLHPNHCGFAFINIVFLRLYIRRNRIMWYDFVFILIVFFIDYRWPKSKTAYYVLIFVFVAFLFLKISSPTVRKLCAKLLRFVPLILIALTVVLVVMYKNNNSFSDSVNETFSQRISQMSYYWENYSVKLFGQYLHIVSSSQAETLSEMHVLDNAYMNCLLGYGIVVTLLFVVGYYKLIKQAIITKKYNILIILIAIFIWGFSETAMIKLECNSLLILFAGCLYSESGITNDKRLVHNKCQA